VAIEDNSTKPCARVDRRQMQRYAIERRRRVGRFPHSGERLGDAFRRFDNLGRSALLKRVAARLAIELRMALDEETVDGPRAVAKAIEERWQGRERLSCHSMSLERAAITSRCVRNRQSPSIL